MDQLSRSSIRAEGLRGLVFDIDDTVTRNGVLEPRCVLGDAPTGRRPVSTLVAVTGRPLGWADRDRPAVAGSRWPSAKTAPAGRGSKARAIPGKATSADEEERRAIRLRCFDSDPKQEVARAMPHVSGEQRPSRSAGATSRSTSASSVSLAAGRRRSRSSGSSSEHGRCKTSGLDGARARRARSLEQGVGNGVVKALRDALDIDLDARAGPSWVFVGDSGNDAAAFELFRHTASASPTCARSPRSAP